MTPPLITVKNLAVSFRGIEGTIDAVRDVSFRIPPGKTVSLVGESGSGKSVISQAMMRILPRNGEITGGQILFADPRAAPGEAPVDLAALNAASGASTDAGSTDPPQATNPHITHTLTKNLTDTPQARLFAILV